MKNIIVLFLLFIISGTCTLAQPTYSKDIAPIIYNQCTVCHRAGEIAPMSFTSYEEVKNWASTIKYVTGIKYMPPWKADPEYSRFLGENYLSDDQIALIAEWADAGAPRGNVADEPSLPDFPEDSVLGEPDLVLTMESGWLHKGNNQDEYRYFVIPTGLTQDRVVKAIELRPGNSKIVHHCLFFEDTTGEAAANDAATPEYGFDGFGGFTGNQQSILSAKQYTGYVPGQKPRYYPDRIGQTLSAGSDLVMQVHYAPWPVDEVDQSTVNIFFADEEEQVDRFVESHIMVPLDNTLDSPFFILPNTFKRFHGTWTVPEDISLIGIAPHMHLLGTDWEVYIESPDGAITNLISIPDWDFNWQGYYNFPDFKIAKAGSKIHAFAGYDNTVDNPNNPSNPPTFVTWGEGTTDEMYYLPLLYVPYENGDENVVFEDTSTSVDDIYLFSSTNKIDPIYPNPVRSMMNVSFNLAQGGMVEISLVDVNGNRIRNIRKSEFFSIGKNIVNINTELLSTGMYFVNIKGKDFNMTEKFIKQ